MLYTVSFCKLQSKKKNVNAFKKVWLTLVSNYANNEWNQR